MNKKLKIFGISATILLIFVAIGPGIASAEEPMDYYRELVGRYNVELTALTAYIDDYLRSVGSLEGITFTSEQQVFMNRFATETQMIYQQHGIPEYPQYPPGEFPGITALYFSKGQIHIKGHPEGSYVYHAIQPCMNHYFTVFWADLIYIFGAVVALMIIGAILLIYYGFDDLDEFLDAMGFCIAYAVYIFIKLQDYLDHNYGQGIYMLYWFGAFHAPMLGPQPQLDGCTHYRWIKINNIYQPNPQYWYTQL